MWFVVIWLTITQIGNMICSSRAQSILSFCVLFYYPNLWSCVKSTLKFLLCSHPAYSWIYLNWGYVYLCLLNTDSQGLRSCHERDASFQNYMLLFTVLSIFTGAFWGTPWVNLFPGNAPWTLHLWQNVRHLFCVCHICARKQGEGRLIGLYDHRSCVLCTNSLKKGVFRCN